jgi:hypothetical protein
MSQASYNARHLNLAPEYELVVETPEQFQKRIARLERRQSLRASNLSVGDTMVPLVTLALPILLRLLLDLTSKAPKSSQKSKNERPNHFSSKVKAPLLSDWERDMLIAVGESESVKFVANKFDTTPSHVYQRVDLIRAKIKKALAFLDEISDLCKGRPKLQKRLKFPLEQGSATELFRARYLHSF